MKNRIFTICIGISLLLHLFIVTVFLSQQKNIDSISKGLTVSLVRLTNSVAKKTGKGLAESAVKLKKNKTVVASEVKKVPLLGEKNIRHTSISVASKIEVAETAKHKIIKPKIQATDLLADQAAFSDSKRKEQHQSGQPTINRSIVPVTGHLAIGAVAEIDPLKTLSGPVLFSPSLEAGVNQAPVYPRIARRRGWEGEVWLIAQVATNGKVREVQLEQSSGYGILDQTALATVREWQFKPQSYRSREVEYEIRIPVRFELRES